MSPSAIFIVLNLVLVGSSLGQMENVASTDDVLKKVSEAANIPGLNASAIPVEEAMTAFKQKCEKNGGPNAYSEAETAMKTMENCVKGLVNVTVLQDEIEKAKPTGDLDIVFRSYCAKSPKLKACVKNFTNTVEACFTEKERENIKLIQNITDSLLSFVCFKEGDRIALFIAAGGPECISSKQSAIQDCVNTTFGSYVPAEGMPPRSANGLDNLPLLLLDTKECTDVEKLQSCVVKELERCNDPTPGNIVDSLFNFIKKVTPCENLLSKARSATLVGDESIVTQSSSSSSSIFGSHIFAITLAFFAFMGIA